MNTKKQQVEKEAYFVLRTKDYDGMGSWEYEYNCSGCKLSVKPHYNFCPRCGVRFDRVKDS